MFLKGMKGMEQELEKCDRSQDQMSLHLVGHPYFQTRASLNLVRTYSKGGEWSENERLLSIFHYQKDRGKEDILTRYQSIFSFQCSQCPYSTGGLEKVKLESHRKPGV